MKQHILIIGNACIALNEQKGSVIDSFDEVVRLTGYVIENFESHLGTKITTYFAHDFFEEKLMRHKKENKQIIFFNPLQIKTLNTSLYSHQISDEINRNCITFCNFQNNKRPSTGLMCIYYYYL